MSKVVMLLLTNGDEVFGTIRSRTDTTVHLDNALVASYTSFEGQPTILLRKYSTYTNNFDVVFKQEHIVTVFDDIRSEMVTTYNETLKAYNETDIPAFANSEEILEFDPDFEVDDADENGDFDVELDDDVILFPNKNKTVH